MAKAVKLRNELYLDTRGIVHKGKILADILYPVGAVYISVNDTNPADLFGGTWEKVVGRYLLAWDCEYTYVGGEWNSQYTTLTKDQIPAHTHTRGTMNITGTIGLGWGDASAPTVLMDRGSSGALSGYCDGGKSYWTGTDASGDGYLNSIKLNAADGWTGSTSSVGGGQGHRHYVEPPYFKCSVWYRTA